MEERRRFVRFPVTNVVEIEPKLESTDLQAITKDVSQIGACIYSDTYLEPGKYIKIKLYKDEHPGPEVKEAVIAWSNLTKDSFGPVFRIGLNIPE